MIAPHGLLHSHINLRGATLVTFGPLWIVAHKERVRIYLRRKQAKKNRGYRQYPNQYLYANLHLYKIPTTAPWTQTAKASGRR